MAVLRKLLVLRFNSTLVRLEVPRWMPKSRVGFSFNSTLVRLEVGGAGFAAHRGGMFQFHAGSIRRLHFERFYLEQSTC